MVETVSGKTLDLLIKENSVLIIDVRERNEYENGCICGAINIPYETENCLERIEEFINSRERKNIVIYCQRGATSAIVSGKLKDLGYSSKSLVGGYASYRGKKTCRQ